MSVRERAFLRRKRFVITGSVICCIVYIFFVYTPLKNLLGLNRFQMTKVTINAFQTDNFSSVKWLPVYFYSNELSETKILVTKNQLSQMKKSDIIGSSYSIWQMSNFNRAYLALNLTKSDISKYEMKWIGFYSLYLTIMLLLLFCLAKMEVKF